MKVLFCVENYYPSMSGVPVVVQYLAEGLSEKGMDVFIATRWIDGCSAQETYHNVQIHRFKILHNYLKHPCGEVTAYRKFILENEFDAVILECAQCVTTDAVLDILNDFKGKKIFHSHGFGGLCLKPFDFSRPFMRMAKDTVNHYLWGNYYKNILPKYLGKFDCTICLSEVDSSYEILSKYGKGEPKILYNAAEEMFFSDSIPDDGLAGYCTLENERYCVSVANYSDVKNQRGILRQFYQLKHDDVSMVFIGSARCAVYDRLLEDKQKYDEQYGKRDVQFLTEVDRKAIPSIVKGAACYLVGSTREEFSISIIEAMAVSTPFVSTDVGCARILPGGQTIKSIDDMAASVDMLLDDQSRYGKYVAEGKRFAYKYCRVSSAVNKLEQWVTSE